MQAGLSREIGCFIVQFVSSPTANYLFFFLFSFFPPYTAPEGMILSILHENGDCLMETGCRSDTALMSFRVWMGTQALLE